jgi:hypothetical protein
MRMLEQMAEALEDQVAALYKRAAAFEEDEFLLNREIEERQMEINRLALKLDAMRADRDRTMERIEVISAEAAAMREEIFNGEEEMALAAIDGSLTDGPTPDREACQSEITDAGPSSGSIFFRRMTLAEATGAGIGGR